MKLVAFDLESTGLDVKRDQILQIAAVVFDSEECEPLVGFNRFIHWDRVTGHPTALAMHPHLLSQMKHNEDARRRGKEPLGMELTKAISQLEAFLLVAFPYDELSHCADRLALPESANRPMVTPVGFNVAAFDVAMLHGGEYPPTLFHHRSIELGTLMMGPMGRDTPVRSNDVFEFLGLGEVKHDALEDCYDAIKIYKAYKEWRAGR